MRTNLKTVRCEGVCGGEERLPLGKYGNSVRLVYRAAREPSFGTEEVARQVGSGEGSATSHAPEAEDGSRVFGMAGASSRPGCSPNAQ